MYLPQYGHGLSRVFLSDPNHDFGKKEEFVSPKFGKYIPQNFSPVSFQLALLTCKWRLNCAVEPNSLQTDARYHGTFKGQGKKT